MKYQRLTIYEDDDVTPWRVFGNDPESDLPYLIAPDEGPELQVDLLKGEATLSLVTIEVGDVALVAGDQDGGAFTDSLAIDGETAYVGRRALWEIEDGLGGWRTRLDGTAGAPALNPDLSSYTLPLRNTLERARQTGAFLSAAERDEYGDIVQAPTVLPQGAFAGYARSPYTVGGVTAWLLDPVQDAPAEGVYRASDKTIRFASFNSQRLTEQQVGKESQLEVCAARAVFDEGGAFDRYACRDVVVLWRAAGSADPWKEVSDIVPAASTGNLLLTGEGRRNAGQVVVPSIRGVSLDGVSDDALPADEAEVEFIVAYIGAPTPHWPRYLEGTLGSLWRAAYDGAWSEFPPRVRYNDARMTELETATPHVFMRVTETASDLREFMQRQLFKPFGWAPALNEANEIYPISQELPDPSVSLVTLDDTNTENAEWLHEDGKVVNVVEFETIIDTLFGGVEGDRVVEHKSTSVFVHAPSLALLGEHKEEYRQISLRSADFFSLAAGYGFRLLSADVQSGMLARKAAVFDRYPWGPQLARGIVLASVGVQLGDWATCGWTWLPDYQTNRRGMSRLMQVVRLKELDENFVEVLLEDAGAANTPLTAPTLGTVTEADGVVTVPVATIPAGAEARVDYAIVAVGDPTPDSNSGEWVFGGRVSLAGDVTLPTVVEEVDVLVRARSEGELRRPSAYTGVQRVTATPPTFVPPVHIPLVDVWLAVVSTEDSLNGRTFYFDRGPATDAIYVYARTVPANSGRIDFDEDDLVDVLTTETEYAVLYPQAGQETHVLFEPRAADPSIVGEGALFVVPSLSISPRMVDRTHLEVGATGTYGITVKDPSGLATALYVATKSGPDAYGAFVLKDAAPAHDGVYTHDVDLIEGHQSYVVFRLDYVRDGIELQAFSESAGMDLGYVANITSLSGLFKGDELIVTAAADSDARQTGLVIIGKARLPGAFTPLSLADYDFAIEDARFGQVSSGLFVPNPGEGATQMVKIIVAAVDPDGNLGPSATTIVFREGSPLPVTPVSIDTFIHTKAQGGTGCGDLAQSSVEYDVTADGTDTVTLEKWIDGAVVDTPLSASSTHAQTFPDDHEFFEDAPAVIPTYEVVYHLIVKTSGGVTRLDAWSDPVTFFGVVDCGP